MEGSLHSYSFQTEFEQFSAMKPKGYQLLQFELGPLQHDLVGVFVSLRMRAIPVEVENGGKTYKVPEKGMMPWPSAF